MYRPERKGSAKCAEPLVVGVFHGSSQEAVGDSGSVSGWCC